MSRYLWSAVALALPLSSAFAADEAFTTRIEPRTVYGATQTIEHGVRVTRPLPAERQLIVNPGGLTPLSLGSYQYNGWPYPYPYSR